MIITYFDSGATHNEHSTCPQRRFQIVGSQLYCVDCGIGILAHSCEVQPIPNPPTVFLQHLIKETHAQEKAG